MASGLPQQFGTTTFPTSCAGTAPPSCGRPTGPASANTGKGQTIALVELGLTQDMFLTLQDYAKANHMPAPSPRALPRAVARQEHLRGPVQHRGAARRRVLLRHGARREPARGRRRQLRRADYGNPGPVRRRHRDPRRRRRPPAGHDRLQLVGERDRVPAAVETNIVHAYLVRAAAEGVGMYFSSGDGSGVLDAVDRPGAIAVGGTTLGIGKTGNRLFETGWSTGISQLKNNAWLLPGRGWRRGRRAQRALGPSRPTRRAWCRRPRPRAPRRPARPTSAADADPFTGINVGMLNFPKRRAAHVLPGEHRRDQRSPRRWWPAW